eukprot:scaffold529_cov322-Pavlova_lutheri.AAC.12
MSDSSASSSGELLVLDFVEDWVWSLSVGLFPSERVVLSTMIPLWNTTAVLFLDQNPSSRNFVTPASPRSQPTPVMRSKARVDPVESSIDPTFNPSKFPVRYLFPAY